ncbi:hypothetical protein NECAME_19502 [Necator americanus]|uniref:Fungal lipase-type domain-containing protein n=1 Tax=Necator americanus TaxID=51031 RepID=W2SGD7_NECAM|nr:hypothetical protein NECAME_19502 [Necator americanus]ETN68689.1 hypothetical protein NECAME_19502 [Necator americanus]
MVAGNYNGTTVKLLTFGQPRVGDENFAKKHDEMVKFSYRVIYWSDIVPTVPCYYAQRYRHQGTEVFYPEMNSTDKHTVCDNRFKEERIFGSAVDSCIIVPFDIM